MRLIPCPVCGNLTLDVLNNCMRCGHSLRRSGLPELDLPVVWHVFSITVSVIFVGLLKPMWFALYSFILLGALAILIVRKYTKCTESEPYSWQPYTKEGIEIRVIPMPGVNAFAGYCHGRRIIYISLGATKLPREELIALLEHEKGHILHHDVFYYVVFESLSIWIPIAMPAIVLAEIAGYFLFPGMYIGPVLLEFRDYLANILPATVFRECVAFLILIPAHFLLERTVRETRENYADLEALVKNSQRAFLSLLSKIRQGEISKRKALSQISSRKERLLKWPDRAIIAVSVDMLLLMSALDVLVLRIPFKIIGVFSMFCPVNAITNMLIAYATGIVLSKELEASVLGSPVNAINSTALSVAFKACIIPFVVIVFFHPLPYCVISFILIYLGVMMGISSTMMSRLSSERLFLLTGRERKYAYYLIAMFTWYITYLMLGMFGPFFIEVGRFQVLPVWVIEDIVILLVIALVISLAYYTLSFKSITSIWVCECGKPNTRDVCECGRKKPTHMCPVCRRERCICSEAIPPVPFRKKSRKSWKNFAKRAVNIPFAFLAFYLLTWYFWWSVPFAIIFSLITSMIRKMERLQFHVAGTVMVAFILIAEPSTVIMFPEMLIIYMVIIPISLEFSLTSILHGIYPSIIPFLRKASPGYDIDGDLSSKDDRDIWSWMLSTGMLERWWQRSYPTDEISIKNRTPPRIDREQKEVNVD